MFGPSPTKPDRPGSSIWLGFVPWLVFVVISRRDTPTAAVVVGLLAAIAVAIPGIRAGRPKILELGTVAFFVVFGAIVIAADPGSHDVLVRYARAFATAGLALIAFGSLALGSPFTEQYAREQVEESQWSSPAFHAVNRRLTALWGAAFVAMTCSHVIAGAIDTRRAETIFNWVIPIVLVIVVVKCTEAARARAGSRNTPS
ncbi:MAG TPA: hypothetical protein VMT37_14590 [Solirubrobacterales bacterium]|nr:hypothetical protein [Solirubrobacterales bacterium]